MEGVDLTIDEEMVVDLTLDDTEDEDRPIKRPRCEGVPILDRLPEHLLHTVVRSNSITDVMRLRTVSQSIRRSLEGVMGIISQYGVPNPAKAAHITTLCVIGPIDIQRQLCVDINCYPRLEQLYISRVGAQAGYGSYVPLFLRSFDASPGVNVKVVSRGVSSDGFLGAILNHPRVAEFIRIGSVSRPPTRAMYRLGGWWFEHPGGVHYPYTVKMGGPFLLDMCRHDVRHAWVSSYGAVRFDGAARIFSSDGIVFYSRFRNLAEICRTQHLVTELRDRGCTNLRGSHNDLIRRIYTLDGLDYDAELEQMREEEVRKADLDYLHNGLVDSK